MKKLAIIAALLLLSGCGEYTAPPYRMATIRVGNETVTGTVETWEKEVDGKIHVVLSSGGGRGVTYYVEESDVVDAKGWDI